MMRKSRMVLLTAAATAAIVCTPADDWPQYRGPSRTGISKETGLRKTWPESGPPELWRRPLGDGYSGMAVAGGRVFTMYASGGDELVAAFEAETGKPIWKFRVDEERFDDQGSGPRSTPTVDEDTVYALGAKGVLVALKAATGEEIWTKDLKVDYDAPVPRWGVSTAPLVEGNLLIVGAGGKPDSSVVALDKTTGKTVWTAYDDLPGYAAPIAADIAGARQVISFAGTSLVGVEASTGKVLWHVPWKTSYDVNAAAPVLVPPDKVFVSSGYDKGAALFRIRKEGEKYQVEDIWKSRVMKNHFNSSILYGGQLYGFDNGTLKCIDAHTGEERWAERGFAKGSLLIADGLLIILGESGQLALADASPEGYVERARAQVLQGRTWTMPSLADGVLYLRNQEEMVALDISG